VNEGFVRSRSVSALVIASYMALLAFDVWFLLIRPDAPWERRIGLLLGILGIYTFAFAFLAQTDVFKRLSSLDEGLTSPNLFEFAAANLRALTILTIAFNVSFDPLNASKLVDRTKSAPLVLLGAVALVLELVVVFVVGLLFGLLLLLVFEVLYVVVVAPIAYTAYAAVSIFVEEVNDVELKAMNGSEETLPIRDIVDEHKATIRNLLIAIPSLLLSLGLNATFLV
jgi:hypothetical protein